MWSEQRGLFRLVEDGPAQPNGLGFDSQQESVSQVLQTRLEDLVRRRISFQVVGKGGEQVIEVFDPDSAELRFLILVAPIDALEQVCVQ